MNQVILLILSVLMFTSNVAYGKSSIKFTEYSFPSNGFKAAFPTKPTSRKTDFADGGYSVSQQSIYKGQPSQYSVFVGYNKKKLFDEGAKKNSLEGFVKGLSKGMKNASLEKSTFTKFMDYIAMEYVIEFEVQGIPCRLRGIIFVVDGDYYRISQMTMKSDNNADTNYSNFLNSFKLLANEYQPASSPYRNSEHKLSVSPPKGWEIKKGKFPEVPAIISNTAGHSITIIDASVAGYNCKAYQQELAETIGKSVPSKPVNNQKNTLAFKTTAFNPWGKIDMTSIHYCFDLSSRVIIVLGAAPKETFFRSEDIFYGVASSLKWQ